jgi:hypothetical protein
MTEPSTTRIVMRLESVCLGGAVVAVTGAVHGLAVVELIGVGTAIVFQCFALAMVWRWWRAQNSK